MGRAGRVVVDEIDRLPGMEMVWVAGFLNTGASKGPPRPSESASDSSSELEDSSSSFKSLWMLSKNEIDILGPSPLAASSAATLDNSPLSGLRGRSSENPVPLRSPLFEGSGGEDGSGSQMVIGSCLNVEGRRRPGFVGERLRGGGGSG